jgi:serine/threonine protein kinase
MSVSNNDKNNDNNNPLNINFDIINIKMLKNAQPEPKSDSTVSQLNSKLSHSKLNNSYVATKYLGDENNSKLFLLNDRQQANNKYIGKQIQIGDAKLAKQIKFELDLLKYLSYKKNTSEYINPCIDSIEDKKTNTFLSIFPIFNGSSLNRYKQHMIKELKGDQYTELAMMLCKAILLGLGAIHHNNIAHQNICENSILISSNNTQNMNVKFTDFGLGCGNYFLPPNDKDVFFNQCNIDAVPVKIQPKVLESLKSSEYLDIAIKNDIWRLGVILLNMLLPGEPLINDNKNALYTNGWSDAVDNNIFSPIIAKYCSKEEYGDDRDRLPEYIKQIIGNMMRPINARKSCKYVADKLIVFEKYIGEDFEDDEDNED